jgi:shikimate kinase
LRIALIGPRAAGKSTLAPRLAKVLGLPCFDLDSQVERGTGQTIAQQVADSGWPAFREAERSAFDKLPDGPMVLAVGAGFALQEGAVERLARFDDRLWLDLDPAAQLERRQAAPRPPLAGESPSQEVTRTDAERRPVYAGLASARIDAQAPADAVLRACLNALEVP